MKTALQYTVSTHPLEIGVFSVGRFICGRLLVLAFTLIIEENSSYALAGAFEEGLVQIHIIVHVIPLVQPHRPCTSLEPPAEILDASALTEAQSQTDQRIRNKVTACVQYTSKRRHTSSILSPLLTTLDIDCPSGISASPSTHRPARLTSSTCQSGPIGLGNIATNRRGDHSKKEFDFFFLISHQIEPTHPLTVRARQTPRTNLNPASDLTLANSLIIGPTVICCQIVCAMTDVCAVCTRHSAALPHTWPITPLRG